GEEAGELRPALRRGGWGGRGRGDGWRRRGRDGEDVHREPPVGQKVGDRLELGGIPIGDRQRGVGRRKAVGVDQPVVIPQIGRGNERHVTGDAGGRLLRVVEGAGPLAGGGAGLPIVVIIEAPEPAVVIHRHVQVHLVTGGAELGRLLRVEG